MNAEHEALLVERLMQRALPAGLFGGEWMGLLTWQWIALLLAFVGAAGLGWAAERLLSRAGRSITARTDTPYDDEILRSTRRPLRLGLTLLFVQIFARRMGLPPEATELVLIVTAMLGVITVAWFFLAIVDVLAQAAHASLEARGERSAVAVVPLGVRVAKASVLAFAMLALLGDAGVDVKKLWASLGIGAIAIALAAQKTLEDVFGGLTLIITQPVRVGDTCRVAGMTGKVEDIALRRTTVRTSDGTQLSISNAQLASAPIENLSRKEATRFLTRLVLDGNTCSAKVSETLDALRQVLESESRVKAEGRHARLVAMSAQGLEVEMQGHVRTTDGDEFLAVQESLLLGSLAAVERCGTKLAVSAGTSAPARP